MKRFIRPAEGLKVRRPDGRHLAETGESVEDSSYWQRRIDAGDVLEGEKSSPAKAAAKPKAHRGREQSHQE